MPHTSNVCLCAVSSKVRMAIFVKRSDREWGCAGCRLPVLKTVCTGIVYVLNEWLIDAKVMETENSYYLVTEMCGGGDLMSRICSRKRLDEMETRRYIRQIVSAVDYLHKAGIIHRSVLYCCHVARLSSYLFVCVCQSVCVFHCFVKLINVRKLTCPVCWENYLDARWARQRSEVWQPGRHQLLWQQHITVTVTFTISQGSEDTATGLRGGRPLVVVLLCEFMLLEKL